MRLRFAAFRRRDSQLTATCCFLAPPPRSETGARCLQRASATYAALPLASPKPGGFRALRPSFDAIRADPFGYYVNVHTQASERIAPDNGQIRGQLQPA